MTAAYLHNALRVILHDVASQGASTAATYYSDTEVEYALMRARTDTIQALFAMGDIVGFPDSPADYEKSILGSALPVKRARITLSGLLKSVAFTAPGQTIPADFWRIECGVDSDSKFVKTEPVGQAESMANTWVRQVYTKAGGFYGTICTLYYWANPVSVIANDSTDLNAGSTPLPDSFYHAVKFRAAAYLLLKERAEHLQRIALCQRIYQNRLLSLK